MASKRVFIVFVLPVIFSIAFGSAVMGDILQKPDRELDMWPMSHEGKVTAHEKKSVSTSSTLEIIGLSKQYSTSEPVEVEIKVTDSSFDCGDLYVTIYPAGKSGAVAQGGFFKQCFNGESGTLPIDDEFSKVIDSPGSYKIEVQMVSKQLKTISTSETFTVK